MMTLMHAEHVEKAPDPYQVLALAVIRQAADDYRSLARMIDKTGSKLERQRLIREMKSISRFFLSEWFCVLSDSDEGPELLERLDQEVFGND